MSAHTATLSGLAWSPLMPWPVLIGLGTVALILVLYAAFHRARGYRVRAAAFALLLLVLANPQGVRQEITPLPDVLAVIVDQSPSQSLGTRSAQTQAAIDGLRAALPQQGDIDFRLFQSDGEAAGRETRLFSALERILPELPRDRLAGIVVITDGQIHDAESASATSFRAVPPAPLHVLLTGTKGESDRRIEIRKLPAFGLVGTTANAEIVVEDPSLPSSETVPLRIRREDGAIETLLAHPGVPIPLSLSLAHAGPNIAEISVPGRDGEPSLRNNAVAAVVNGVRDRLRVLLVSGEPHVGERAWRRLLKSDPNVDLVHFTILRPPFKDDGTPLSQLALIAFPVRELFEERLGDFDLVIFDRFSQRTLMPDVFLARLADYVKTGGALLMSVGPEAIGKESLYQSSLADVLPAIPTGRVLAQPFLPEVSSEGSRHPITAGLKDVQSGSSSKGWGPWLRAIDAQVSSGAVLMTGPSQMPLLVTDHIEKGRVALFLSDSLWLWGRGYKGGGPQSELLRRSIHWLMQEPDLEEEALSAWVENGTLIVERRTLSAATEPRKAEVSTTDDGRFSMMLEPVAPGRFRGTAPAPESGILHVTEGGKSAVAIAAATPTPEAQSLAATAERLHDVVEASRGGIFWLSEGKNDSGLPNLQRLSTSASRYADSDWLGLRRNEQHAVGALREIPLIPPILALVLILGVVFTLWIRESR